MSREIPMIHMNFISAALLGFLTVYERVSRDIPEMFAIDYLQSGYRCVLRKH